MEQNVCLVILSILVVYLLFKDLQRNESFVNESFMNDSFVNESFENITLGSADDQNAINKLAQIATQLMAGAVTVPGAISLSNNKTKFSLVNDGDDVFRLKDNGGTQLLAINHQGGIWSKDNSLILSGGNLALTGGLTANGDVNVGGALAVKGVYGGTVSCNTLFTNSGSLSVYKDNGWQKSNIVCGGLNANDRNILAELDALNQYMNQLKTRITFPNGNMHFNFMGMITNDGHNNGSVTRRFHVGHNWSHAIS